MNDILGRIINFEMGELDTEDTIALFVDLLNTGIINGLQGSYQRSAYSLIEAGFIARDETGAWFRTELEIE